MPVLEILEEDGRLIRGNRAGIIVLSSMLYPSDEKRRDAYEAAVLHQHMIAENPGLPIPAGIANLTFTHGGEPGVMKNSLQAFAKGLIAGETLFTVLRLATHAPEQATIRRAQRLVGEFRSHKNVTGGKTLIETAWSRFKIVSHLWAAFVALWIDSDANEHLLDDDQLPDLLSNARWYASAAATHHPPGTGSNAQPVLDPTKIWAIPNSLDILPVEVELPPLSGKERESLTQYRHD